MNRKLNVLIAAGMTVMTLSACSTPAPSSTTPAGTTAPVTAAITTAAATTPPATTASTQPPASTAAAGTHTSEIANVYIKSAEAMAQLNSFRITSEAEMELLGNKIKTITTIDMFPKEEKSKFVMEMAGQKTEMYLVNQKMYMKGADNSWTYFKLEGAAQSNTQESVQAARKVTDAEYQDMFKIEKTATGYKIETKRPLTTEDFKKLGSDPNAAAPNPLESMEEPVNMTYEMEQILDSNYYTTETTMHVTMENNGEKTVSNMIMKYSDFNKVPEFSLPSEASNAKEFTIPGMPSTTKP